MKNYIVPIDQNQRFNGTIIRYAGIPYYVSMHGPKMNLYRCPAVMAARGSKPELEVDPYDDKVDISSIPLGNVNLAKIRSVAYLMRRPLRKFQQGISEHTVMKMTIPDHIKHPKENEVIYRCREVLYSQEFEDAVLEKYPTVEEGLKLIRKWGAEDKRGEVALGREIAMSIDKMGIIKIYFRNSYVGWIAPEGKVVNVPSNEMGWIVSMYLQGLGVEIN